MRDCNEDPSEGADGVMDAIGQVDHAAEEAEALEAQTCEVFLSLWANTAKRQLGRYAEAVGALQVLAARDRVGRRISPTALTHAHGLVIAEGHYLVTAIDQIGKWLDRLPGGGRLTRKNAQRIRPDVDETGLWRKINLLRNALEHANEASFTSSMQAVPAEGLESTDLGQLEGVHFYLHETLLFGHLDLTDLNDLVELVFDNGLGRRAHLTT
jgi:hypothetical protein